MALPRKYQQTLTSRLIWNDLHHLKRLVEEIARRRNKQEIKNATPIRSRCDGQGGPARIAGAGYVGDEFLPRRSGAERSVAGSSARGGLQPYRAASRAAGCARRWPSR